LNYGRSFFRSSCRRRQVPPWQVGFERGFGAIEEPVEFEDGDEGTSKVQEDAYNPVGVPVIAPDQVLYRRESQVVAVGVECYGRPQRASLQVDKSSIDAKDLRVQQLEQRDEQSLLEGNEHEVFLVGPLVVLHFLLYLPLLVLLYDDVVKVGDGEEAGEHEDAGCRAVVPTLDEHVDQTNSVNELLQEWCIKQVFKGGEVEVTIV